MSEHAETDLAVIVDGLAWAVLFFQHRDEMNAAVHYDNIRWSPITEAVCLALQAARGLRGELFDGTSDE